MTGDGTHTYEWDAEDRMVSVDGGSTATQKYNALGQRVERFLPNGSWTFDYLFSPAGEELGLYSAGTAAWFDQNVPMGGRVLVMYGSPSRFLHANNLGTTTVTTDQTGAELQDELFYPWGQDWTRAGQPYVMHFAGMQGFENPGLVYPTDFRKYNPALGRWLSPDPMGGDVTNPQSLNRYAYVTNNPTTLTDPLGLDPCDPFDPLDCGPPCDAFDPEGCQNGCNPAWANSCVLYCYELGTCNGRNGGGGGGSSGGAGGGGGTVSSAPPAGQPPLRGGTALQPGAVAGTIDQFPYGGAIEVLVAECGFNPVACGVLAGLGAVAVAGYYGYRLYEQLKPQPKAVPVATPAAKPTLQNSGKQTKCTHTGIDWGLGFCTYSCDDGQPEAKPIPPGGQCEPVIYRDWR